MRKIREGTIKKTVNGPMYQHHDVWLTPFDQEFVKRYSDHYGMDENHVIGKIVEAYVGENSSLDERMDFFNKVTLPNVLHKRREVVSLEEGE